MVKKTDCDLSKQRRIALEIIEQWITEEDKRSVTDEENESGRNESNESND
ncbi:hypothetical protein [Paenibacillus anaericanus]|nr:hypothetical protein [Paenibacillus anaericanus]